MLTPDLVRIFICLVAVCNQCKGWIQNTHWIHWHFSFCSLYLHLSRGLMLVVLCSVLKKSSYNVLSKLQIGFGSFVCILRRGDYLSSLGFVNI